DSTNAEVPGFVTSEVEIGPVLDDVVRTAEGRVVVACFASHVHRVQQVLDAAEKHKRKVAFVGRSMVRNMGVASDLGLLRIPDGIVVDIKAVEKLEAHRVLLVSTGSQGEPLSALSRMANRSHHQIRIDENDTVVLASSLIPGNENAVYRVINGLSRWGARVVHKGVAKVHVSGHAPAGELLYLLNAVKPSNLMPIHGEWRHLRAHAELGRLTGVDSIVLADDGVVVDLVDGRATITGAVPCGYVYVDGLEVGDVGESTLRDRRILGEEGFISLTIAVDSVTGKIAGAPQISAKGFTEDPKAFDDVLPLLEAELDHAAAEGVADPYQLGQQCRRLLGRWVNDTYRRRPMIIPVVLEV
ncbi:MAG: ribonuclease, partial [Frankiales bacterium]|nr:ribonuclease [Frankiales bacterium]